MSDKLDRTKGRGLFAVDIAAYDSARPDYPEVLYQAVVDRTGGLGGSEVLEIGAGNGLASKRLLQLKPSSLTLVEPDTRFRPALESLKSSTDIPVNLIFSTFEQASSQSGQYDHVFAATCFHWLDPETRLQNMASLLKTDGYAVLMWNVFGDDSQADPFHDATQHLFGSVPISPSNENRQIPFALDVEARTEEFRASRLFAEPEVHKFLWPLELDTEQMLALYRTFSGVNSLAPEARSELLMGLREVADEQFDGTIIRNMTSIVYTAKRTVRAAE